MKSKINDYVKYMMSINSIDDTDMFEEITSNLHDRFDDLLNEGYSKDEAYLKVVNNLGDFNFEEVKVEEKYKYKPNWANISLMVSLGLAVLSTIALLLHTGVSLIFTGISVSLYIASAYYLYHLSKYALNEEKDVKKHNSLLKGMFTNLKTSFVFWNINISYWVTSIVVSVLSAFGANPNWILELELEDIYQLILLLLAIFIIVFTIIFTIFISIYKRLENKYLSITNEKSLESYFGRSEIAQVFSENKTTITKIGMFMYMTLYGIIIIFTGVGVKYRSGRFVEFETFTGLNSVGLLISLLVVIFIILSTFIKPISNFKKVIIMGVLDLLMFAVIIVQLLIKNIPDSVDLEITKISELRIAALTINIIVIIVMIILKVRKKKKNKLA